MNFVDSWPEAVALLGMIGIPALAVAAMAIWGGRNDRD